MRNEIGKKGNKKALSPVVATVLLIALVVVIAMIVFLWMKQSVEEKIVKFGDQNIEVACQNAKFEVGLYGNEITVTNTGNIAISDFLIKKITKGKKESFELGLVEGLPVGSTKTVDVSSEEITGEELLVIPILLGESSSGQKEYVCDENDGEKI